MSTHQCLNSSQSHITKFINDDKADKTRSTQNLSKICQNCRLIKDELEAEIFTLKDKSHQSFMQVIQVQQLHEQQIQLMKIQHQQQITALRQEIVKLQYQVNQRKDQIVAMQKNSKHHICDVEQQSFHIDNIQIIECNQELDRRNKLDDSSFDQFNQIVESKFLALNENNAFSKHKENDSHKQLNHLNNHQYHQSQQQQQRQHHHHKTQKLTLRIAQLQSQVESLWQTNQQLKKQCLKLQANQKSIKNNYDSLYKQSKFMADHIRTLANDKFRLERKVKEIEKEMKEIKNNSRAMRQSCNIFEEKQSQMSIKINGSGIFNTNQQDFIIIDNVRNSLQNSTQEKQINLTKSQPYTFSPSASPHMVSIRDLQKQQQPQPNMTKSQLLHPNPNNQIQSRKSMPNYKKVSHISPSFKKTASVHKPSQKQKVSSIVLLKSEMQEQKDNNDNDKSDFMDQIRREIELKVSLKKSIGPGGFSNNNNHDGQRQSLIPQNFRKRPSVQ